MNDEAWMRIALSLARRAFEAGETPVGAAVVKGDVLIAAACNGVISRGDPTAHAEMLAIRQAARALGDWRLTGCTLYVTLEPCAMCAGAVVRARLSRLVWGARDPVCGCAGSLYRLTEDRPLGWYAPSDGGVLARPCGALLDAHFARCRAERHIFAGNACINGENAYNGC